ncbi:MAG TPA: DUF3604 domain-containing protein [Candidatus Hydrogenedentes bacterium]|nr:DUF3604 domain-containing protein [Candidatus Hydrogenedentota bacterium]
MASVLVAALLMCMVGLCCENGVRSGVRRIADLPSAPESVSKTVFRCGFETAEKLPAFAEKYLFPGEAFTGQGCLKATFKGPEETIALPLSLATKTNLRLSFAFRARGAGSVAASAKVRFADGYSEDVPMGHLSREWSLLERSVLVHGAEATELVLRFQNGNGGTESTAWIDDIEVEAHTLPPFSSDSMETAPAMAFDARGALWLATLARSSDGSEIRLWKCSETGADMVWSYRPAGVTAFGRPAMAPSARGMFLTFAAERNGIWQIHYASFPEDFTGHEDVAVQSPLGCEGILPNIVSVEKGALLVWEGLEGSCRVIRASCVDADGAAPPVSISSPTHNSRSPSVCALSDGRVFAVWDSFRRDIDRPGWDLYGAWFQNGAWGPEIRITFDPRLERHAQALAHGNDVWLAWEACTFKEYRVHWLENEQIVVARYANGTLEMPLGWNQSVLAATGSVRAPAIAIDGHNNLWVSCRRWSDGWEPILAQYAGNEWESTRLLDDSASFSTPVPFAFAQGQCWAAIACEDMTFTRSETPQEDAHFACVSVVTIPLATPVSPVQLETEPLALPDTGFALTARLARNAPLPSRPARTVGNRAFKLCLGDLHEHSDLSVCLRKMSPRTADLLALQKDMEGLDFAAITDHDFNLDPFRWVTTAELVRAYNDPEVFVTFLGQEWTKDIGPPESGLGHRNIIHVDPCFPEFFTATKDATVESLWRRLDPKSSIVIPHQLADTMNCPVYWNWHDPELEPVAEIWQHRGSYEAVGCPRQAVKSFTTPGHFLQDAWSRGIVAGVVASPDHGGGYGKTGVWAEALTREAIFEGIKARRTFATTDGQFSLFVTAGDHVMGEVVESGKPSSLTIHAEIVTPGQIQETTILRNNEPVHTAPGNGPEQTIEWTDSDSLPAVPVWYYVRVTRNDGEIAWSSPIWFTSENPPAPK